MWKVPLSAAALLLLAGCSISQAEESVSATVSSSSSSVSSRAKVQIHPLPGARPLEALSSASSVSSEAASSLISSTSSVMALPPAVQLEVPFTSQAPFKNWDEPYQNACEETSLLTLLHYLDNVPFTQELADQEIVAFTRQTQSMGYGISITLEQLAEISRSLYPNYEPTLYTDVTEQSLKQLLAQGKPVIIPTAGKILNNPFYSGGGPYYHMLVVTGYDQTYFYTNDVGTGHGERYPFTHEVLIDAIHDWAGQDEKILEGKKIMMTLEKR
jgi:uncharacterized protein YvpB